MYDINSILKDFHCNDFGFGLTQSFRNHSALNSWITHELHNASDCFAMLPIVLVLLWQEWECETAIAAAVITDRMHCNYLGSKDSRLYLVWIRARPKCSHDIFRTLTYSSHKRTWAHPLHCSSSSLKRIILIQYLTECKIQIIFLPRQKRQIYESH